MNALQIKRSDGLEEFEAYLGKPSTFQKTLLLPNDLDEGGGVGTSVAYCQFLLTWARRAKSQDIKTYLKAGDDAAFEKFTERLHGLSAAYFSERLIAHTDKGQGDDIRLPVLRAAKPRFEAMSRGELQESGRGREIEFIFVQDARNQFHGSVYSKVPTPTELMDRQKHGELIRSHRELNRLLELCFEHINVTQYLDKQIRRTDFVFGALLSELFRNTAEHGFLDIHGGRLKLNLRCIRVAATLIARDKLAHKSVSSPDARHAAQQYFAKMAERRGEYSRDMVRVLELSVFDSGPGFAATIEGQEVPDVELARQAVARCFRKHQSAKTAPRAGEGLFKVLGLLNVLGGFVRVRTSTVEAFHGAGPEDLDEIDPDSFVHGGLSPVEGSVVTICIPITY
jgi:hypothetical protein